jgi:restriction system protein
MDCLGPECAASILEWLESRAAKAESAGSRAGEPRQGILWKSAPYQEEAPAISSVRELAGAIEHLQYAVFRRYNNQVTRAERSRLENTIDNALFKVDRFLLHAPAEEIGPFEDELRALRRTIRAARDLVEKRIEQARRADLKLAQLSSLSGESFEEFVAELFEMLDFEVERVGGSGDQGVDLRLRRRDGLLAVAQCKYHKQGLVGSPELQKFLGTIHHTRSQKGFFVTTSTFTLSAEKFAADNPIELLDGPRLVELVHQAMGPKPQRATEPLLF